MTKYFTNLGIKFLAGVFAVGLAIGVGIGVVGFVLVVDAMAK